MPEPTIPDELIENMMQLSREAEGIEYPAYEYEERERGLGEKLAPALAGLSMMIRRQSSSRRTRAEALTDFQRTLEYLREQRLEADVQHERAYGQQYKVATGEAMFKANRIQEAFQRSMQLARLQESMQEDVSDKDKFLKGIAGQSIEDISKGIKEGTISGADLKLYAPGLYPSEKSYKDRFLEFVHGKSPEQLKAMADAGQITRTQLTLYAPGLDKLVYPKEEKPEEPAVTRDKIIQLRSDWTKKLHKVIKHVDPKTKEEWTVNELPSPGLVDSLVNMAAFGEYEPEESKRAILTTYNNPEQAIKDMKEDYKAGKMMKADFAYWTAMVYEAFGEL